MTYPSGPTSIRMLMTLPSCVRPDSKPTGAGPELTATVLVRQTILMFANTVRVRQNAGLQSVHVKQRHVDYMLPIH